VTLAASYHTSRQAGGDYYDLFALPDGRWGILIADVSGHGTPAAVVMAITHAISHSFPGPPMPPGALLTYVNQALATRYTADSGNFVTAFYGIFDPATRELVYSSAGHNPPRLRRADGGVVGLDGARSIPLGILPVERYSQHSTRLASGEAVLFYTDGISEAWSAAGEMFGTDRLDDLLTRPGSGKGGATPADRLIASVLEGLGEFTKGRAPDDDRTLLALCVGP
jgi:sigma-B regulation protein RsbU (phosphoserine phosphatase)